MVGDLVAMVGDLVGLGRKLVGGELVGGELVGDLAGCLVVFFFLSKSFV
jgi:hypothetical protein